MFYGDAKARINDILGEISKVCVMNFYSNNIKLLDKFTSKFYQN